MAISQIAWQVAYRRYVRRNAVAIYGLGWGSAQCLVGWGRVAQCRTAHFLHNASVATNLTNFFNNMSLKPEILQFIETEHT